jgi:ankyrin repeat protein
MIAMQCGYHHIVKKLIECGASLTAGCQPTPLRIGITAGQVNCAELILKKRDYRLELSSNTSTDAQDFEMLCQLSLWDLAISILERQPRAAMLKFKEDTPSITGTDINCAIDYLVRSDYSPYLFYLIKHDKAALTYLQQNITKIYQIAIRNCCSEAMLVLTKFGLECPFEVTDKPLVDVSPSYYRYKDYDLIQFAMCHGLARFTEPYLEDVNNDIEHPTADGKNLLYLAAQRGKTEIISLLLKRKAQHFSPNKRHFLYPLIEYNHTNVIYSLALDKWLDVNAEIDKRTHERPLDLACKLGNLALAEKLIQIGARSNQANAVGKLPIFYAIRHGHYNLLRLIYQFEIGELTELLSFAIQSFKHEAISQLLKAFPAIKSELKPLNNNLLRVAIAHKNQNAAETLIAIARKENWPLASDLLLLACQRAQAQVVSLLLAAGLDINYQDHHGNTAMHYACQLGHDNCIAELIHDPRLNTKLANQLGKEAVELASTWTRKVILAATDNLTPITSQMISLIQGDSLWSLKRLIAKYEIPLTSQFKYSHHGRLDSLIMLEIAILEQKYAIVDYLLAQDNYNLPRVSALEVPIAGLIIMFLPSKEAIRLIEKHYLKLDLADTHSGMLPLHVAALEKNLPLVKYVYEHSKTAYQVTNAGTTVMDIAIEADDITIINYLLKHSYNINHKNAQGLVPLATALRSGSGNAAKLLISSGADLHVKCGEKSRSLMHYAVMSNQAELVQLMLSLGLAGNESDSLGTVPIHLAAKLGNLAILELLNNQVFPELTRIDARGRDCGDFALIHGQTKLSQYMTKRYCLVKDEPTNSKIIGYKSYKRAGLNQLELALLAEDEITFNKLLAIKKHSTEAKAEEEGKKDFEFKLSAKEIKDLITIAGQISKPQLFVNILSSLLTDKNTTDLIPCLMVAIIANRFDNVKLILDVIGIQVTLEDGSTPVSLACAYNQPEVLNVLLTYLKDNDLILSENEGYTAIINCIKQNSVTLANQVLDVCSSQVLTYTDGSGYTLLHHAVIHNRSIIVALLLMYGSDVMSLSHNNLSAEAIAIRNNYTECAKYLKLALQQLTIPNCDNQLAYELKQWLAELPTTTLWTNPDPESSPEQSEQINLPSKLEPQENSSSQPQIELQIPNLNLDNDTQHYQGDQDTQTYQIFLKLKQASNETEAQEALQEYRKLPHTNNFNTSLLAYAADGNQIELYKWLLKEGLNPYLALTQRLTPKKDNQLYQIFSNWHEQQLDKLFKAWNYKLDFKVFDGFLDKLDQLVTNYVIMPEPTLDSEAGIQICMLLKIALLSQPKAQRSSFYKAIASSLRQLFAGEGELITGILSLPFLKSLGESSHRPNRTNLSPLIEQPHQESSCRIF